MEILTKINFHFMPKSPKKSPNLTIQELKILNKYGLIDLDQNLEFEEGLDISKKIEIENLKQKIKKQIDQLQIQKTCLEDTKTDFETFYPTQIMTSAWEIFYAWIIRMIMTGKYFTGQIPFEKYFCHAWVLDEKGRKMSKSLGNVVDPSLEIAKYSSDAVRLSLLAGTVPGKNLRYQGKAAEKYRNFITKIVNVAKFFEYQESLKNNI